MTEGKPSEESVAPVEEPEVDQDSESSEASAPEEDAPGSETAEPEEDEPSDPAADDWTDEELERATAALIFASPDPLSEGRLVNLLGGVTAGRVRGALESLEQSLEQSGLPFVLKAIAGGWRLFTSPEVADVVARLARARKIERISPAALETLAIIAYRQPVTKAEIEAIRGVQAGAILRSLVDRGLAKVTGRADQPGSPLQYGTTREFLDRFELESLKDLPRDGELVRD